jgi:serine/threonine protein kinase
MEIDLVMKMIALNPCKRITARQALKHPYFDDFDKNSM